jgi:hypothetical protein
MTTTAAATTIKIMLTGVKKPALFAVGERVASHGFAEVVGDVPEAPGGLVVNTYCVGVGIGAGVAPEAPAAVTVKVALAESPASSVAVNW